MLALEILTKQDKNILRGPNFSRLYTESTKKSKGEKLRYLQREKVLPYFIINLFNRR